MSAAVAGQVFQGLTSVISPFVQYGLSEKLAEKQNQFNLEMWNKNNEYNSPQAQMRRFEQAGLNPNLIYGQGTAGNSPSAPVKSAPQAPDITHAGDQLAKAFNIVGLQEKIQEVRRLKAEADTATINSKMREQEFNELSYLGNHWDFDPSTGRFIQRDEKPNNVTVYASPYGRYLRMKALAENFHSNAMYFPRLLQMEYQNALLNARERLTTAQKLYLDPQIEMGLYDAQYYPWTFWINNSARAIGGISDVVGMFNPAKWIVPKKLPRQTINYNTNYNPSWHK